MITIDYKGCQIKFSIYQVGKGHAMEGRWVFGEYSIGVSSGDAYTETQFCYEPRFADTEEMATQETIKLGMSTIGEKF
jgi:hypothetical protein